MIPLAHRQPALLVALAALAACAAPPPRQLSPASGGALAVRTGSPDSTAGALIVLPGDLALEYAPGSLRLAAVRRGALALPGEHGLEPAGEVLVDRRVPDPPPLAALEDGTALRPRLDRLGVGEGQPPTAGLSLSLLDPRGIVRARIEEEVRALAVGDGFGYLRRITVHPGPFPCRLSLELLEPLGPTADAGVRTVGSPARGGGRLASGGREVRATHLGPDGLRQELALSQPRGVRVEGPRVLVELDRTPITFELSESFAPADDGGAAPPR